MYAETRGPRLRGWEYAQQMQQRMGPRGYLQRLNPPGFPLAKAGLQVGPPPPYNLPFPIESDLMRLLQREMLLRRTLVLLILAGALTQRHLVPKKPHRGGPHEARDPREPLVVPLPPIPQEPQEAPGGPEGLP